MASKMLKLFSPLTLGGKKNRVQLQHRVIMAPLTRLRTGEHGGARRPHGPSHHSRRPHHRRSDQHQPHGSRLLRLAWAVHPGAGAGLEEVTEAVHAKQGKIFVQLWHSGRVGHSLNQPSGEQPVSSSTIQLNDGLSSPITRDGERRAYSVPRALETHEIPAIVADYKCAAEYAIEAGFDGVELHGANGYLLEQFLCDSVNKRTDRYGGSIENRARLMLEALDAVLSSLDSSQMAIRLSPFEVTFGCTDSTPDETYGYVLDKLNARDLAYVHIVEPRGFHFTGPRVPKDGTTPFCRSRYNGVLMTSSGFDRAEGIKVTESGAADCVAYGRPFISNPDFVHRLKVSAPLNPWDRKTFYMPASGPLSLGYTDYPTLENKSSL